MTRGHRGSLVLRCRAFSSPSPGRFIPAFLSGQFFLTRAVTLLVFAGIWAMLKGITDIVRAFQIRQLGSL